MVHFLINLRPYFHSVGLLFTCSWMPVSEQSHVASLSRSFRDSSTFFSRLPCNKLLGLITLGVFQTWLEEKIVVFLLTSHNSYLICVKRKEVSEFLNKHSVLMEVNHSKIFIRQLFKFLVILFIFGWLRRLIFYIFFLSCEFVRSDTWRRFRSFKTIE